MLAISGLERAEGRLMMSVGQSAAGTRTLLMWVGGIVSVFAFFMASHAWPAENGAVEQVQQNIRDNNSALYRGDVDTVLSFTLPRVIELMGGRDAARAQLSSVIATIRASGMELMSLTFPAPPQFVSGGGNQFVVVPTLSVIRSTKTGVKAESLNFQVGMFDATSKSWKYVEGSRVNDQMKVLLLPGFPSDFKFPQIYRKKI
jgi:hypothetical protein